MKRYNNVNYHKVTPVIKSFINQAITIVAEDEVFTEEFLNWLDTNRPLTDSSRPQSTHMVERVRFAEIHRGKRMCAIAPDDYLEDTFEIRYNLEELADEGCKQFRKDFEKRCPMAKGFADITIALLHEIGHHACGECEYEDYDREEELKFIRTLPYEMRNLFYFLLPDEMDATNWAIEWLQNPNNRKIAKQFEKKFFNLMKNT